MDLSPALTSLAALLAALSMDAWLGEPPNALHPVVWMGKALKLLELAAPTRAPTAQLLWGAWAVLVVPGTFAWAAYALLNLLSPWPWLAFAVQVYTLKCTFSLWGLKRAAWELRRALEIDLDQARFALRSLCSRDAAQLEAPELIAATVESVAENASDSFVAPLFYFALFGLPGAVAYRAVNTLDAMVGYRGRYERLGKIPARTDDLLNLVPARLTAALLWCAGWLRGEDARGGIRIAFRDHQNTESPNAGWPMATMAGLLRVRLTKPSCYALGDDGGALDAHTIERAWRVVMWMGILTTLLASAVVAAGRG